MRLSARFTPKVTAVPALLLTLLLSLSLSGCALSSTAPSAAPAVGASIQGTVHGGQQPVTGARVYLLAAATSGYGAASTSLLTSGTAGSDSIGGFVLTSSPAGSFSIGGDYTCTPGQQIYLYAAGGNPGSGINSAAGFLAVLGSCPQTGSFAASIPFITVNEVTTVAAAYALSGFAIDATHIADDEAPTAGTNPTAAVAKSGLANAFANASNLADVGSGAALATTPAGTGTVPQPLINTLANILAICVNSVPLTPPTLAPTQPNPQGVLYSSACTTLFANALSAGTSGLSPRDTATAAINIAHHPGANVSALFNLAAPNSPFTPQLVTQPSDLSVSLIFAGGGIDYTNHLAVDAQGNVWVSDSGQPGLDQISPLGAVLSPQYGGFTSSLIFTPGPVAIDSSNNVWLGNNLNDGTSRGSITEFNASGAPTLNAYTPQNVDGIAIDTTGNIWVDNATYAGQSNLAEFSSAGVSLHNFTGGGLNFPSALLVDLSGNVWAVTAGSNGICKFSPAGVPDPASPIAAGGMKNPQALVLDSTGDIWVLNGDSSLSAITSAGAALPGSPFNQGSTVSAIALAIDGQNNLWSLGSVTPPYDPTNPFASDIYSLNGFSSAGVNLVNPTGITLSSSVEAASDLAVDNAGNLWIAAASQVIEVMGLTAPIVTPNAAAMASAKTATRP